MALSTSKNTHAVAVELGVLVVAIHLRGVYAILPKGPRVPRRAPVEVTIAAPLPLPPGMGTSRRPGGLRARPQAFGFVRLLGRWGRFGRDLQIGPCSTLLVAPYSQAFGPIRLLGGELVNPWGVTPFWGGGLSEDDFPLRRRQPLFPLVPL